MLLAYQRRHQQGSKEKQWNDAHTCHPEKTRNSCLSLSIHLQIADEDNRQQSYCEIEDRRRRTEYVQHYCYSVDISAVSICIAPHPSPPERDRRALYDQKDEERYATANCESRDRIDCCPMAGEGHHAEEKDANGYFGKHGGDGV